jgi:hypothetical protein
MHLEREKRDREKVAGVLRGPGLFHALPRSNTLYLLWTGTGLILTLAQMGYEKIIDFVDAHRGKVA